jgi:hypothetical protein
MGCSQMARTPAPASVGACFWLGCGLGAGGRRAFGRARLERNRMMHVVGRGLARFFRQLMCQPCPRALAISSLVLAGSGGRATGTPGSDAGLSRDVTTVPLNGPAQPRLCVQKAIIFR